MVVFQGCGAKRMVKKAVQFEEKGLYAEAADYYLLALSKNNKNVDAVIGLKKNGLLAFNDLVTSFESHHKQRNHKEAVYQFLKIKGYEKNADQYGVVFTVPARTISHYKKDKSIYLGQLYTKANSLLDQDSFELAMIQLKEIEKFEKNYKDIQDLKLYAKYEPKYRQAKNYLSGGRPRIAYQQFHELAGYRDSEVKKEKARKEASLSILVLPFYNNSHEYNVQFDLEDKIIAQLVEQQNPFIQIIENRQNISPLDRAVYHANKTGKYPSYKNKRKKLKAKAVLIGEILLFKKTSDRVKAEDTKGYAYKWVESTNGGDQKDQEKLHNKVYYNEHKGSSKVEMHFSYKLISTETGETLFAEVIQLGERDKIHYASYEGDSKTLVPGYWKYQDKESKEDYILDNQEEIQTLRDLFESRKKLTSIPELKLTLMNKVAYRTADGIISYNPER